MVLAAATNQHSSSQRRACSTSIIENVEHGFDAVTFRTIRPNINMLFLLSKGYIAIATHDEEVRCGVGGHPKSTLIRTGTRL